MCEVSDGWLGPGSKACVTGLLGAPPIPSKFLK
jgi:hypothetical protein